MAIRWDKFTVKAQEAVQRGNELASEHGNPELLPLHLLAALLEDREGIVPPVLEKIGIGPQAVLKDIYEAIDSLPKVSGASSQAGCPLPQTNFWIAHSRKLTTSRTNTSPPSTCCSLPPGSSGIRRRRF